MNCKFCHKVLTDDNANCHVDCYWAWAHKVLAINEGHNQDGGGGGHEVISPLKNVSTPAPTETGGI